MTGLTGTLYQRVVKPVLFHFDPEDVHDRMLTLGKCLGEHRATRMMTSKMWSYAHPALEQTVAGVRFPNPIGLSAGFDKNAELTDVLPAVGFGFMEVGSITAMPCEGNAKPRLWRHPETKSLRVFYGLKNDGAKVLSARLKKKRFDIPVGISIAKTNCAQTCDTQAGIQDYVQTYRQFSCIGAYDTINISCPNAFGGQPFTDAERLDQLLHALNLHRNAKPIFLKISPDLSITQLDALAQVAKHHRVDGLICSNLTKQHAFEKGGLSGGAVSDLALTHLRFLHTHYRDDFVLVSCGGIFTAQDVYERIKAGASLVQLITGMIYQGPQVIGEVNKELVQLLQRDGYASISDAIGADG